MSANTIKTVLFFLLVLSIAVPTTVVIATETHSAEHIDNVLKEVQPYVEMDDQKIGTMDIETAKQNGVSDETLKIAKQFLIAQNNMIQRIHDNPNEKMYVADEDYEGLQGFRESIKEGKQGGEDVAESLGVQFALAEDVCGGSGANPHPQPPITTSGTWSTKTAAINALPSSYHLVPFYASYNYGDDYHDPKTLYNCTTDSFRYQSIVYEEDDDVWKHSEHHSPGESLIQKFWHTLGLFGGGVFMSRNGTSHHTPYFFKKPKIIFTTLLATVLCLGSVLVIFGGERKMTDPIQEVTLNIAITGLIFLYLSLLALLPFSWMKDGVDGNCRHTPYFFKKPKIIFTTLLATVLFLGGGFVLFGGHFALLNPINGLTLNIAITGLIFLYLSLLALLPFSWKRMKDSMNDKTYEQDNQRNGQ